MNNRYRFSLLSLFGLALFFAAPSAHAQLRTEAGVNLSLGLPQGQFESNLGTEGFGASVYGAIGGARTPFLVGVDLGVLIYGHERRNEPFSTTIPDVTVDVVTSNNIFLGHLFLRLQPPAGPVRPYLDGLFGLKHFFTDTRIENEGFGEDGTIATSTNFDDTAMSYGVGGGAEIKLYRGDFGERVGTISLHLGVRYLFGAEATYLKEGSVRRENGQVAFDLTNSETNILLTQIGVAFRF